MKESEIISASMNFIAEYIKKILENLDSTNILNIINEIIKTKRIFLIGAGRSGLEAKAFAMRLIHLGFEAYVIGEYTAPVPMYKDLVIIISGSGETKSVIEFIEIIKRNRPKLALITIDKDSSLGKMSDIIIVVPIIIEDIDKDFREYVVPMGTLFEAITHIFLDAVVSQLKAKTKTTESEMKIRHMFSEYVGII